MKCDECNNANICLNHIELPSLVGCTSGIPDRKVTTNADRIRIKTIENGVSMHTVTEVREWLQSEAE